MIVDALLSRLEGAKQTGPGRWLARCPAHGDKRASLSIRELDDGRILLHCFAECGVNEIVAALGLTLQDLFPERAVDNYRPREGRPFPAADVLRAVAFEVLVASMIATRIVAGRPLSDEHRARILLASTRLLAAVDYAGLNSEAKRLRRVLTGARAAATQLDREDAVAANG